MTISDRAQRAWENCLQFGDSEEVRELLSGVEARYVSWDEFERTASDDGRPYDIGALLQAGAEIQAEAASSRRLAFFLRDDGTGSHVLLAASEDALVEELLRVGAVLEEQAARISSEGG